MVPSPSFVKKLFIQTWILYAFGLLFIFARLAARRLHLKSFRKFQIDDYIMLFTTLPYTVVFVAAMELGKNGSNYSRLSQGSFIQNDSDLQEAIFGSKMALVLEESLLITIWIIKACLLLMYHRLTLGLWQHTALKIVACYCFIGFVVIEILLFGVWCRPLSQYWAVPPRNSQCATYYNSMITTTVFNISSDIMILLIPLPILLTSIMPLKRKLVLCGVFSLGIFVILAAILNRYYNFTQKYSLIYINWYLGEVSTAVMVANTPLLWPLFRRIFTLDSWGGGSSNSGNTETSNATLQANASKRPSIAASGSSKLNRLETLNGKNGSMTRQTSRRASTVGLEHIDIDLELGDLVSDTEAEANCGMNFNLDRVDEELSGQSDDNNNTRHALNTSAVNGSNKVS